MAKLLKLTIRSIRHQIGVCSVILVLAVSVSVASAQGTARKTPSDGNRNVALLNRTLEAEVTFTQTVQNVNSFGSSSAVQPTTGSGKTKLTFAPNGDVYSFEPGKTGETEKGNVYKLNAEVDLVRDRSRAHPAAFQQFEYAIWRARTTLSNNRLVIRSTADQTGIASKMHVQTQIEWAYTFNPKGTACTAVFNAIYQIEAPDGSKKLIRIKSTNSLRCTLS